MRIFISWSGDRSKALASALKDWLPTVLQYVQPWMSSSDINSGERWSNEIAKQLQETNFGILCVTKENLEAPWLLFEAGALAKSMQDGRVIPLRLDVENSDITGPLQQFHSEKADSEGVKKLLTSLNASWTTPIADEVLQNVFDPMWAVLAKKIEAIPESEISHKKSRSQAEVLEDLVSNVRNMEMRLRDTMDDDPMLRRKFRRRMHPGMMMELTHFIGARRSDPIHLLISASLFKDELPWLYELALETYRSFRSGNIDEAKRALDQYRKAVEALREGPFLDMLGMDSKMAHMTLRDTLEFIPLIEDLEPSMSVNEPKLARNRKRTAN
jgi:TIR domain